MEKRTAVVTGATSGIGLAVATELAGAGASVFAVGRDAQRCDDAKAGILRRHPDADIHYMLCDLSSQDQIRSLSDGLNAKLDKLDLLIHVAGGVRSYFMTSEDGIEWQFAVNHLAPFLLTHGLLNKLDAAGRSSVVTVSSGSHYGAKLNFSNLQMNKGYGCLRQYRRVKLCNVLFTVEFNRRFADISGIRAFAADPGLVNTGIGQKGTGYIEKTFWGLRRRRGCDPSVPAHHIVRLAGSADAYASGEPYWKDGKPKPPNPFALNPEAGGALWEASEKLAMTGAWTLSRIRA